jgi:small-conductance mechanosensitive channel
MICLRAETAIASRQDSVIERISDLKRAGKIRNYRVIQWPRRLRLTRPATDRQVFEAYERFDEAGIEIPFPQRTISYPDTPELDASVESTSS